MFLIADSGSTKTDWIAIDKGRQFFKTSTIGLNPIHVSRQEVRRVLGLNHSLLEFNREITELKFFGAGCSDKKMKEKAKNTLHGFFRYAKVKVQNDLTGAARATCGDEKGIICILGTGSNCCFYDGKKILPANFGLGYILGDEASGAYFGKKILTRFLYGKMSLFLHKEFKKEFHVTKKSAIDNIYHQPHANQYLASFMPFIIKWRFSKEIQKIISEGLYDFFETNISSILGYQKHKIHFVGSVGFYLQKHIRKICTEKKIHLGKIVKKPIDGLFDYYRSKA
jgi:N-acetylglucosamine kinase-like BadF-type ATPase